MVFSLSNALGDLRFLADQLDSEHSKIGITEGMAIMDARRTGCTRRSRHEPRQTGADRKNS